MLSILLIFSKQQLIKFLLGKVYYTLNVNAYYGDAGNSLSLHNGMKFSTIDRDNDEHGGSCAVAYKGAWW